MACGKELCGTRRAQLKRIGVVFSVAACPIHASAPLIWRMLFWARNEGSGGQEESTQEERTRARLRLETALLLAGRPGF